MDLQALSFRERVAEGRVRAFVHVPAPGHGLREASGEMMERVLVLQHAECEKPGTIAKALKSRGYSTEPVLTYAGQPVAKELGECAGLVIMGGPMGVYEHERYPFIREEMSLIESALKTGKPVLGVCLGSQLLASALGAAVRRGTQKEIGWFPVTPSEAASEDALCQGLDRALTAYHWHGDVFDAPEGASSLAFSALTACQAFRYGQNAYGFLFHMEITPEILRGMVRTFAAELEEEGIAGDEIIRESAQYLPPLEAIGNIVFGRWAALLGKSG